MGRYGPTQKPGLIHFLCGFDEEKNLRKITSIIHPMIDPEKKRNAKIKKIFMSSALCITCFKNKLYINQNGYKDIKYYIASMKKTQV